MVSNMMHLLVMKDNEGSKLKKLSFALKPSNVSSKTGFDFGGLRVVQAFKFIF